MNQIVDSLQYIKPEISAAIFLVVIVIVDLVMGKNKKYLSPIMIIGLLVTGFFIIDQFKFSSFAFMSENNKYGLLSIDSFGSFFKLLIVFSSIIIFFFTISSDEIKKAKERLGEYYTLIWGMILGMFFMIIAADLIVIYLAIELLSLSSYVLAGITKDTLRNSEASLKYVIYGGVSSGIMLFGISILYGITGTTNIYEINGLLQSQQIQGLIVTLSAILIFAGIGFKISVAPFHFWTPDVYEGAPITITAYLSVASKAAGFALLFRFTKITFIDSINADGSWNIISLIDWRSFLIIISILTMTLGNFAALWQNNMKRLLAYSSIAHAGYLLLGLIAFSNEGMMAVMIYFVIYAIMNLGAFFVVMLIANKIGSEELDDYKGLGKTAPVLTVSLGIFMISLIGLPPTAGFIGKLYLFLALINSNMILIAFIALLNTVVSVYYYVRVLKYLFIDSSEKEIAPFGVTIPNLILLLILVIPTLILGVYFTPLVEFAKYSITLLGF